MREISLHAMDLIQNALHSGAGVIRVSLETDEAANGLVLEVEDDGPGPPETILATLGDPFAAGSCRLGVGLSLLHASVERTGGQLFMAPAAEKGTMVRASYTLHHVNRPPIGDMAGAMHTVMVCNPSLDFVVRARVAPADADTLDTREMREKMGSGLRLDEPQVSRWLRQRTLELFPAYMAN